MESGNKIEALAAGTVRMNSALLINKQAEADAAERLKIHAVNSLLPARIRELLVRYRTLQERG
jgi:hypothetical protein